MLSFVIIGSILLIWGLIMIFFPRFVIKLNEDSSRVLFTDAKFFSAPKLSGTIYSAIGVVFVLIGLLLIPELKPVLLIIGVICILIGLIFLINPRLLIKFSEVGNKLIFEQKNILNYPRILGIILSILSVYMIYLGFTL